VIRTGFNRASAAALGLLMCFFLTQCAQFSGGGSREGTLKRLGYVPLKLEKMRGDVRFSGVFKVNGKPMRFLIDSGANSTDVAEKYANKAGLVRDHSVSVVSRGALGRAVKGGLGRGSLQMGPVYAREFPFTIGPSTGKHTATSRYAGQIGLDVMSGSGALIDIPGEAMWVPGYPQVRKGEWKPARLGQQPGLGLHMLRLYPAGNFPHLILEGEVDGDKVTWVVDTGAEVSVMAQESFEKFRFPSQVTNSRMIDAAGDRVPVRAATLYDVKFPGVVVKRFDLVIAPLGNVREKCLRIPEEDQWMEFWEWIS